MLVNEIVLNDNTIYVETVILKRSLYPRHIWLHSLFELFFVLCPCRRSWFISGVHAVLRSRV